LSFKFKTVLVSLAVVFALHALAHLQAGSSAAAAADRWNI
jgi:hypothetical protein